MPLMDVGVMLLLGLQGVYQIQFSPLGRVIWRESKAETQPGGAKQTYDPPVRANCRSKNISTQQHRSTRTIMSKSDAEHYFQTE